MFMEYFIQYVVPVSVAVLVKMGLGALWYSPILFGKLWMKLNNYTEEDLSGQGKGMIIELAGSIVFVTVLNIFILMPRVISIGHAIFVGLLIWIGFMVTTQIHSLVWQEKSFKLFLLDCGHQLAVTMSSVTILFLFR
jgi:hypothetical protein